MQNVTIEIDDLVKIGAIQDEPSYQLPPEAWSSSVNMRDFAGGVELIGGQTQVFGSGALADAPTFVMYLYGPTQDWWLWTSNTDAYVWDGSTNDKITRSGSPYNATDPKQWNGTVFGGIPIVNNGIDPPQFWNAYSSGTDLANLTNFPANTTCRVIRSFLSYLVALNLTTSGGGNTPHLLQWSTEASPGNLPSTWNPATATQDAGAEDLSDAISGPILDGLELNGQFIIYKANSVWRMTFIGGTFIFSFQSYLETAGLLATRCVAMTGDGVRHVFVSQDDMIVHNGITAESLLDRRMRRYLFNLIDSSHYDTSFMWSNPLYNELWFCFPISGSSVPNHAIIWNYKYNTLREADASIVNFQCAAIGNVPSSSGPTWAAQPLNWNQDTAPWGGANRRRIVVTNNVSQKMLLFDAATYLNDGATYTGTLERDAIGLIGRKRSGEWLEDFERLKLVQRLWPKIKQGPVNVQVGYQALVNGPISWGPILSFDPASQIKLDTIPPQNSGMAGNGRAVSLRFYSTMPWRLDGYKFDMALLGKF